MFSKCRQDLAGACKSVFSAMDTPCPMPMSDSSAILPLPITEGLPVIHPASGGLQEINFFGEALGKREHGEIRRDGKIVILGSPELRRYACPTRIRITPKKR